MGVIIRNGIRYSGSGSGASELTDLEDVNVSSPQNGQALKYNSTTQKFENGDVSAVSSFADLTDTTITNPTNNQVPVYNSTSSKWENKNMSTVLTQAEYDALVEAGTVDPDVEYYIPNGILSPAIVDDNDVSTEKTWSSKKISDSLPITFEFDVENVEVNLSWGNIYTSNEIHYNTNITLTNKKIFAYFIPSTEYTAQIFATRNTDGTKIGVLYSRPSSGTINGKLYVMVTN